MTARVDEGALDGVASASDGISRSTTPDDHDLLARRVDVLTRRIALMAERERRTHARLLELALRASWAEELADMWQKHVGAVERSVSWRLTAPLRRVRALRRG